MKIESLQNNKVKEWCKLKEKKYRDQTSLFLIEGDHLLKEAFKKGVVKEIIALDETLKNKDIPFYQVTNEIMKKISSQVSATNVIAVCKKQEEQEIRGNVCILDDIQDPGNLGTIIRSAVAFEIQTLILSNKTVDVYNEKVIRASEGMMFHLNIIRCDLNEMIPKLKEKNYIILGTEVKGGKSLGNVSFQEKNAVIIGNEGRGMQQSLQKECDELIYIPMNSKCESLNAGVSASIIFYEMKKERKG